MKSKIGTAATAAVCSETAEHTVQTQTDLHKEANDKGLCGGDVALLAQPLDVLKGQHHTLPPFGRDG